jgi:hypothetical protein
LDFKRQSSLTSLAGCGNGYADSGTEDDDPNEDGSAGESQHQQQNRWNKEHLEIEK